MWSHYLLTLYRSLTRHRLYAALNVLGLAVGVSVFLVLWLDVRFETSFEKWIPDASQLYVVGTLWKKHSDAMADSTSTMGGTLEELRADYPQLVGTRIWPRGGTTRRGAEVTPEHVDVVDPNFFKVFELPLVEGDPSVALAAPDGVVLTQAEARRYFGAADPMGRRLTLAIGGVAQVFRVTGVLHDPPKATDENFDFLVPITPQMIAKREGWRHWGSEQLDTYVRFASPAGAAALRGDMDRFVDRHAGADVTPGPPHLQITLTVKPLLSLHLLNPKDAAIVAALGLVGLFTLLLAAVNYVNLATARAGLRAREVALRKVMGATPPALFGQFMAEALVTALLAALIGLALCELALPEVNAAGGLSLQLDYLSPDGPVAMAFGAAIVVGLGAGLYPAWVLASYRPAQVLASARAPGGGRAGQRVREALVVFQFAIAIAFTVATGVILAQMRYIRSADLGFRRDGLVVVNSLNDGGVTQAQRTSLLQAWKALPGVTADTAADMAPGNDDETNGDNFKRPGDPGDGPSLNWVDVQPGFFDTYGARLVAGRTLTLDHGGDDKKPPPAGQPMPAAGDRPIRNVVLNEGAVRLLRFHDASDAIGKPLLEGAESGGFYRLNVVGVIRDIRFRTPRQAVPPTLYMMDSHSSDSEVAAVRYANAQPRTVLDGMAAAWRRIAPDVPFRAKTIEDNLDHYYRPDEQHGRLFTLGALLAVAIGCVGLYGLASFNTARRVKEIGIRKTLGASTADILRLLVGQLLRPVALANLLAWPLAWIAMRSWLGGFDQRIGLSPLYFVAATALTLLVALATVVGQALLVARAEPAKALRHD